MKIMSLSTCIIFYNKIKNIKLNLNRKTNLLSTVKIYKL